MSLAYKISEYNRNRKWRAFIKTFTLSPNVKILDVGFTEREYSETDNYLEKHFPYQHNITALGVDQADEFRHRYPAVNVVTYRGGKFPFDERQFDICWSNAVIEHVGNSQKQLVFLQEIRRVAKHGYLTTPNRMFPFEVHTRLPLLHYLPKPWFDAIIKRTNRKWAAGDYMHLLSERALRKLLQAAGYTNYTIIKNRLVFIPLDFVVVF